MLSYEAAAWAKSEGYSTFVSSLINQNSAKLADTLDQGASTGCWSCCFLATACVEARGLPLDCAELTVLRGFRDSYMRETGEREALVALYSETRALQTQQEDLRSQARAATEQIKQKLRAGDKIRARLGSTLKGKLGFNDVTLAKYGFKPAPVVRRSKAKSKSKTPPATNGTPADTTPASQGTHPAPPAPAGSHP